LTTGASLVFPKASAVDALGNIYVANNDHTILKITPLGVASVFAGQPGVHGFADGTGSAARFTSPEGIAVNLATGNVYVSDSLNNTIRKITPAGDVTTFAGSPGPSDAADGTGPAARFAHPKGVAVDSMGNIYVSDADNSTIRKITPGRVVTTLAGSAGNAGSFDGTGSTARFNNPNGIAVDGTGQIYVADSNNHTIRKITPAGVVSTLAGLPGSGGSQDGQGCAARFYDPVGVAVDNNGDVVAADNSTSLIRKVTAAGVVTTLGGKPFSDGNADGVGSAARFFNPGGVTINGANQLLVTDTGNSTLRTGTPAPQPAPMNHVVTNTNDSGPGSLRQALSDAQSGDTISFSSSLNGQAITLTSNQLTIAADIAISGPGANLLTIRRSSVVGTSAFRIFEVTPDHNVRISGLTISNGNANGAVVAEGGGIFNDRSFVTVDSCMFSGNTANNGGALSNSGASGKGAGLTLLNSTLQGNSAIRGGALFNASRTADSGSITVASASVSNCTFSGNTASDRGGAVCNGNSGFNNVAVINSTFSDNAAPEGTALYCTFSQCSVGNSIFKGFGTGQTVVKDFTNPPFVDRGYNVLTDDPLRSIGSRLFGSATNQVNTDPRLGPPQNNGGPTLTHAPLVDSPAIDKGKDLALNACNMPLGIDQRGFARPVRFSTSIVEPAGGDGSDVGAVELAAPAPSVLANISTRTAVGKGDNVLIGGFYITGSESKKIVIRAIGPSLAVNGAPIMGRLADPTLELHDSQRIIATNDNWRINDQTQQSQQAEIEATTIPPSDDLESAIVMTLPPGPYTVVLRGQADGTGIAVVEIYDLGQAANSQMANLSTRGFVETGNGVLIGGFILGGGGGGDTEVIVRALGPSLNTFGLTNPLADPVLTLYNNNGEIVASNDDWKIDDQMQQSQEAEVRATTIPPPSDLESAIVRPFPPGAYTALVTATNEGTGVGLVEVYNLTPAP